MPIKLLWKSLELRSAERRLHRNAGVTVDRDHQGANSASPPEDVPKVAEITEDFELELGEEFSGGAYANIYKATMIRPGGTDRCQVAVKILRNRGMAASPQQREQMLERIDKRLSREMEVWKQLEHPRITPLLAYVKGSSKLLPGTGAALISPYRENANLLTYLSKKPDADRLLLLRQVCEGLNYMHTFDPPIAHLDLKPENILVNDTEEAELCDFGLAKALEDVCTGFTTSTLGTAGTLIYMPPEALNAEPQTTESDIYAMGGVILQVMSGDPPWRQTPSVKVMQQVLEGVTPPREGYIMYEYDPPAVEELWILMQRCWSFIPSGRPTAMEVLSTLVDLSKQDLTAEANSADYGGNLMLPIQEATGSNSRDADESMPAPDDRRGHLDDLSMAIEHYREALNLCPPDDPDLNVLLIKLGGSLRSRYDRDKNLNDLNSAIQYHQESLDLRPPGHPARDFSLLPLAYSLMCRYHRDKNPDDLNSAIQYRQEALYLRPPGHPNRDISLHYLAYSLMYRYHRDKNPDDLNSAIQYRQETLDLRPPGHPEHVLSLHNLGETLECRYNRDKNPDDLDSAIRHYQEAVDFCPPGHPSRSLELRSLADALEKRHRMREGRH